MQSKRQEILGCFDLYSPYILIMLFFISTDAQPAPGVSVTHTAQSYSSPGAYAAPPQGPPPPYSYVCLIV